MKFFNTAGPCDPRWHYMLPPEPRLPEAPEFIARMQYFVVHAPRQTGKTTVIASMAKHLTASGDYTALTFSCEAGRAFPGDVGAAEDAILADLGQQAIADLPSDLRPPVFSSSSEGSRLRTAFAEWAGASERPLVLFLDEIDSLQGETLKSVLSQIRAGYRNRPDGFPASVILCGMRDVRDYRAAAFGTEEARLSTSSPFNVKVDSLRLGNFTADEVQELYAQHTEETGQVFTEEAVERAFFYTQGQPWLVNAIAREVIDKMRIPASEAVTPGHIDTAKERLILARATHLDSLHARLAEPRVRRIIEPVLAGSFPEPDDVYEDDVVYVRDLGLIALTKPIAIANPIYAEVIPRVLSSLAEDSITAIPRSFVLPDGRLDFRRLLTEFADFWRQHGDILTRKHAYHEVAPQLVFMAWLQRLVSGGGTVTREYGIGRGRIDVMINWPYVGSDGRSTEQREAIELKVWHPGDGDPLNEGLTQLDGYLDRLALPTGTLVIFDRRPNAPALLTRIFFEETRSPSGRDITLLRA